jgi:dephospho-CoA kinase
MGKLIGLTGTYCAGKNHIAALLEARGLPVLDVDKLGHQAIEAEKKAIFARFGQNLGDSKGNVDRRLLGERVFGKPEELAALEAIVHPAANRLTEEWIAQKKVKKVTDTVLGRQNAVINAALLHKSSAFERLDFIILVEAPFLTRLIRARKRDGLSWFALIRRFASQKNFTSQYLSGKADIYKVDNRGDSCSRRYKAQLESRINAILSGEGIL